MPCSFDFVISFWPRTPFLSPTLLIIEIYIKIYIFCLLSLCSEAPDSENFPIKIFPPTLPHPALLLPLVDHSTHFLHTQKS